MADYTTEFLSIYITKDMKTLEQELFVLNGLFDELNTNDIFNNYTLERQISELVGYDYASSMDQKDISNAFPLIDTHTVDVLRNESEGVAKLVDHFHALFTRLNTETLPGQTPTDVLNRVTEINGMTHINLAISRKRTATDLMNDTQALCEALFGENIKQMKRVSFEEYDAFDASKAEKII